MPADEALSPPAACGGCAGCEHRGQAMAKRAPVYWMAWVAFVLALVAFVLALYGSLYAEKHIAGSPLRQARGSAGLPAEPTKWYERLIARGEDAVFGDRFDRKVLALTERS